MLHVKSLGLPLHLAELPDAPNTQSQDCTSVCTMMAAHTSSVRAPSGALPGSATLGIHLHFLPGFFHAAGAERLPNLLSAVRKSCNSRCKADVLVS